MSETEGDEKLFACFRDGGAMATELVRARDAQRSGNNETLQLAASRLREVIERTECVDPVVKERVKNATKSLESFARSNDRAGINQSLELIRGDLALPVAIYGPPK